MNLYFAYGAHLSYFRLLQSAPTATVLTVACLPGYQLSFQKRSADGFGRCTIRCLSESTDTVFGVVYLLGGDERARLDREVGRNAGYEVISVSVLSPAGPLEAFTYIAQPNLIDSAMMPARSYLDTVIEGANDHRLPDYYINTLRGFSARVTAAPASETEPVSDPVA